MHECSPGESLTRAAFMHHDDKGHSSLKHCSVLKGLKPLSLLPASFLPLLLPCVEGVDRGLADRDMASVRDLGLRTLVSYLTLTSYNDVDAT